MLAGMELTPRGIARSVVRRANSFGATPISSRGVLNRAVGGPGGLKKAVNGKVVLITGASTGIGRAAAVKLAAAGAQVLVVARSEDLLDELVAEVGATGGT